MRPGGSSAVFAAGAFVGRLHPLRQPTPTLAELAATAAGLPAVRGDSS